MKFYLKYCNPAIAVLVLVICTFSATSSEGGWSFWGIYTGSMSSYFFAKGLFCSSALFISGRTLLELLEMNGKNNRTLSNKGLLLTTLFSTLALVIFFGGFQKYKRNVAEAETVAMVKNPKEITIQSSSWIKESEHLMISVALTSSASWKTMRVVAPVFLDGRFAEELSVYSDSIKPNEVKYITLKSDNILTCQMTDTPVFTVKIDAEK